MTRAAYTYITSKVLRFAQDPLVTVQSLDEALLVSLDGNLIGRLLEEHAEGKDSQYRHTLREMERCIRLENALLRDARRGVIEIRCLDGRSLLKEPEALDVGRNQSAVFAVLGDEVAADSARFVDLEAILILL